MIPLKSTLVLSVAWLITLAMRNRSAAMRHLVWTAAMASVLVLPFLSISLPTLRVPAPDAAGWVFQATVFAPAVPHAAPHPSLPVIPAPPSFHWQATLTVIWAVGTIAAFARMIAALFGVWRLRRKGIPARDADLETLIGIRRPVDILETAPGTMPMACGIFRPAVFLPEDASRWTPDRRRTVMLHELAHIRRGDAGAQLLARIALSVYWWNPLAWMAWQQFLREQERAADDMVLACGTRASDYADHLLAIARTMRGKPALLSVAMARPSQLEGRLTAILDSAVNRHAPGRVTASLTALLAVAMILPLAAARPQTYANPADVDATILASISQRNKDILTSVGKASSGPLNIIVPGVVSNPPVLAQQQTAAALGLLMLADRESKGNIHSSFPDVYLRAMQTLGAHPNAGARKYLGVLALKSNPEEAYRYFEQAKDADPALTASSLMWMAIARQRQQRMDEAEGLFREALSQADPKSSDAFVTMKLFSEFLRAKGSVDEANDLAARANATQIVMDRPSASPGVYRVGNGVTPPAVLEKRDPEYTEEARAAKLSGTVALSVEIGPDGLAHNIGVTRELGLGLDEKAVEAVQQWHFKPGTKDGQPVTVMATIEVNFRLL